ncbi:hypothetical protein KGF56_003364 [Candida oxycetoniae]|uniref:G-patch domain-containing protein n=1 Tax=Candida oxycetoniae TaxID=497107 RepID=A0AAI9SW37_9ASCO|nr:uncharacterized protein KGF56_003364 [Candida oxycetoniae]KAI3403934.2 hypothetical protein KGF56_003364 [Candida oxycetoniae]
MTSFGNEQVLFQKPKHGSNEVGNMTVTGESLSMIMAASGMHDEYSDLEDSSDDVNVNVHDDDDGDDVVESERRELLDTDIPNSSIYSRYGIGAKLLMRMGYQEGKGLGSNQTGIVNPIESIGTKGRSGVGFENPMRVKDQAVADLSLDAKKDSFGIKLERLKSKVFDVMFKLEKIDAPIPHQLQIWLRDVKEGNETDIDLIENIYKQLITVSENLTIFNQREKLLDYELQQVDDSDIDSLILQLSSTRDLVKSWSLSTKIENLSIDQVLEQLTTSDMKDTYISESVFLSILKPRLDRLLGVELSSLEEQEKLVVPALCDLSQSCSKFTIDADKLCQFDSFLFKQYSKQIVELLKRGQNSKGFDGEEVEMVITTVLSLWMRNPVFVNSKIVFGLLLKEIFIDHIMAMINTWDVGSKNLLSITVQDYLTLFSNPDTMMSLHKIYEAFCLKIRKHIDYENPSSVWFCLSRDYHRIIPQIKSILEIWIPEISLYEQKQGESLLRLFEKSFVNWIAQSDLDNESIFDIIFLICEVTVSMCESTLAILMYMVFNTWIGKLISVYNRNPQNVPEWYSRWYSYFCSKWNTVDTTIQEIISWYLTKGLTIIQSNFDAAVCDELPMLGGLRHPNTDQFFFKDTITTNAHGIPLHQLLTTFKDIVFEYCSNKEIMVKILKDKVHRNSGSQIIEFSANSRTIYGYIDDDVLWVCTTEEFEDGEYEPILLPQLARNLHL